ncbi:putative ATP-dependent helicase [Cotonvirus japonicus]|uniref:ATP-dependent helicase n=1 Tax=Cotonvirus japonicus TaxID=2811091 RepID=A0ABM7NTG8_9VIRU|nr:putative ATP-dependent helicase [Cotonvirus japonicus]BCS83391.1 putative ATP-dependent helicase [Cotonvirus japonicus]
MIALRTSSGKVPIYKPKMMKSDIDWSKNQVNNQYKTSSKYKTNTISNKPITLSTKPKYHNYYNTSKLVKTEYYKILDTVDKSPVTLINIDSTETNNLIKTIIANSDDRDIRIVGNNSKWVNDKISDVSKTCHVDYISDNELLNLMLNEFSNAKNYTRGNPTKFMTNTTIIIKNYHVEHKILVMCLNIWRSYYESSKINSVLVEPPKLVVLTNQYDKNIISNFIQKIPTFTLPNKSFMISTVFDSLSSSLDSKVKSRYLRAAEIAKQYTEIKPDGIVVVYVPGKKEFGIVKKYIEKNVSAQNIKRVVITIDIIDTYNVCAVVDTMTCYRNNNLEWISENTCFLRKNTLSKLFETVYVVTISENDYHNLPTNYKLSIDTDDIINMIRYDFNPSILNAIIDCESLTTKLSFLSNLGIINNKNQLTSMGKFCLKFPLDLRRSTMLYYLSKSNANDMMLYLLVVCTIETYGCGIFSWPKKLASEDQLEYNMKIDEIIADFEEKFAGYSDLDTIVNIWLKICRTYSNPLNLFDIRKFCDNNNLIFSKIKTIISLTKDCLTISDRYNLGFNSKFNSECVNDHGKILYNALELSHSDCRTTITYNHTKHKIIANLAGQEYCVDNRSISKMNVANNSKRIYYALSYNKYTTYNDNGIAIINLLHTIPDKINKDNIDYMFSDDDDVFPD